MIWWTGLAPWESEFLPGSFTFTFQRTCRVRGLRLPLSSENITCQTVERRKEQRETEGERGRESGRERGYLLPAIRVAFETAPLQLHITSPRPPPRPKRGRDRAPPPESVALFQEPRPSKSTSPRPKAGRDRGSSARDKAPVQRISVLFKILCVY